MTISRSYRPSWSNCEVLWRAPVEASLPQVDIVIAAKNEAAHIGECLAALQCQDYPADRLHVYVVDNGSTDETVRIARTFDIEVTREPNGGAAAARNRGLGLGSGALVGFLDAHCIPNAQWVQLMAGRLVDPGYGGCQGATESRATDERVQRYLERNGALTNDRILDDTVSGKRNIYPWILSGNCMYRRAAIAEVGGFNEVLAACEDLDLAWRVLLQGYQLGYVPGAKVIHYETKSWSRFLTKGRVYGAGAAQLARAYRDHGARNKFQPHEIWGETLERSIASCFYWLGYRGQSARIRVGFGSTIPDQVRSKVRKQFRTPLSWTETEQVHISENCIFWLRDEEQTSVVVHLPTRTRVVLDSAADVIWRSIVERSDRATVVSAVSGYFNVSPVTASADLDEFIEESLEIGILERTRH